MAGVDKSRADAFAEIDRVAIAGAALEQVQALLRIGLRIQWLRRFGLRGLVVRAVLRPMRVWTRFLLLQVSGIQHDQLGEDVGGHRRDDLDAKGALGQERQPPAMIEVGVRQQHKIEALGIESEVAGVFVGELAAALVEPAIDQDAPAGAFDEVARPGDVAIGAVKRQFQTVSPAKGGAASRRRRSARQISGVPHVSYQSKMLSQISWADSANQNSSRSSSSMTPSSARKSRSTTRRQYSSPTSTTGTGLILRVCTRVKTSNNSSMVPNPPGKATNALARNNRCILRSAK